VKARVRSAVRRFRAEVRPSPAPPILDLSRSARAVAVCHPDWRGIAAATAALGVPVFMSPDLEAHSRELIDACHRVGADLAIVSGYVPGTAVFARLAREAGLKVRIVFHSSMAQHGSEAAEAQVVQEAFALRESRTVDAIAFVKKGQAEAMTGLGFPSVYLPPAIVRVDRVPTVDLGPGVHLGIFGEAGWRKNITTQIGAAAILGATAHVVSDPGVSYLSRSVTRHEVLPRPRFLQLLGSVDLNLYVSLYECFPVLPQESIQLGALCLVSRTSALFDGDEELWALLTVDRLDNPSAIADAARRLLTHSDPDLILEQAQAWLDRWDTTTREARSAFLDPDEVLP
jgi:hypothetical protein